MLLTLLSWHLMATAALLALHLLVVVLQWSAARVRRAAARSRTVAAGAVAVPPARRDGEVGPAAVGSAA